MSETTQTSQSLYQALWNSADVLRSKMDANDYKSYLLGMVFYKYLSDKMLFFVAETMEEETESLEEHWQSIVNTMRMRRLTKTSWQLSLMR